MISFSIVINTLNRAAWLQRTLNSLRHLRYPGQFEVIVVNGPSSDHTDQVIETWLPHVRAGACSVANLSVSRNIGICMARGDVVAFIDDDAIPEPEWLSHLAHAYVDPQVGGAGGKVCDRSGFTFQYEYATATRLADVDWRVARASEQLCFPGSFRFPYLQGTNSSFRRAALLEVDGFDEEFEYYLDETDMCCRLIDAGFLLKQLATALVHHEAAPNTVRDQRQLTVASYPILKNTLYFALKHGRAYFSLAHIAQINDERVARRRRDVAHLVAASEFAPSALDDFDAAAVRARDTGMRRALAGQHAGITARHQAHFEGTFTPFSTRGHAATRTIVLISRDYPPGHHGGIATFSRNLAEALARAGHQVHVIAEGTDTSQVRLDNDVWLHRIIVRHAVRTPDAIARRVPQKIWNWSATALAETQRIAALRAIDVVEAPVWDAEGVAMLLHGDWPLVTSLHTTLQFWLHGHPELRGDVQWMADFGTPMLALEREVMEGAHAVRANSQSIRREIEAAYGFLFDARRLCVTPHGVPDVTEPAPPAAVSGDTVTLLFVGRLEARKGIDVLLAALPQVLAANPQVHARIVGDNTIAQPGRSKTYLDAWRAQGHEKRWAGRVTFDGRIDDIALRAAYRECDVFVAPSRFESFGLVFLEAMREGKPVIGSYAGGMPEVVDDGVSGLLPPAGDSAALREAILRLAGSAALRDAMGRAGRARFLEKFTAGRMAAASLPMFDLACANYRQSGQ